MNGQLDIVFQILAITGPVFVMVVVGWFLKRFGMIDDSFISTASNLTYRITMPLLLFIGIVKADLNTALQPKLILYFSLATILGCAVAWLWAIKRIPHADRGVFVQGAFRGNCGVVALALAVNQFGDYGLSIGSVLSGLVIILFNILSTIVLSVYSPVFKFNLSSILKELVKNPLIVSVMIGLAVSYTNLMPPTWFMISGEYLASMTLPIALICIGGTLSLSALVTSGGPAISASMFKLILIPAIFTLIGKLIGFEGRELGILFLFLAAPTAAVSYVMAKAAGGDARFAANIIALSTALSIITISAGLYTLSVLEWL